MASTSGVWFMLLSFFPLVYSSLIPQISPTDTSAIIPRSTKCQPFEGNSDFYGLGIRIGIYLQWLSSWIANTAAPKTAASNHDTNSTFVLAIIIPLFLSISNETIKPVEAYIMLLFCFGFFYTILSHLGIRIFFMNPSSCAKFIETMRVYLAKRPREQPQELVSMSEQTNQSSIISNQAPVLPTSRQDPRSSPGIWREQFLQILVTQQRLLNRGLNSVKWALPFKAASSFKHPSLSWGGVAWRSTISSLVAIASILLWFSPLKHTEGRAEGQSCETVFLFGVHSLDGSMLKFLKVASIIFAIPEFYLGLLFLYITSVSLKTLYFFIMRSALINTMERWKPGLWDSIPDSQKIIFSIFIDGSIFSQFEWQLFFINWVMGKLTGQKYDNYDFWTIRKEDLPSQKDLIRAQLSFWSRGIEAEKPVDAGPVESTIKEVPRIAWVLCWAYHLTMFVTIGCFIVFVEVTIVQNGISGVYSLASTGQLIPFIIGIVTSAAVIKEIALERLRDNNSDFGHYYLSLDVSRNVMVVKKVNEPPKNSEDEDRYQPTEQTLADNPPAPCDVGTSL